LLVKLAPPVTTDRLRLRITRAAAAPCVSEFSLYRMPVILAGPDIQRASDGKVIVLGKGGGEIRYTIDGTTPTASSRAYAGPFDFPDGGPIQARVLDPSDARLGPVTTRVLGMVKADWKLAVATAGKAQLAIDDNPATFWHTHPLSGEINPPQGFTVDMQREVKVAAFTYLPRQDGTAHGLTDQYRFELSRDGRHWLPAAKGEFSNIRANPVEQVVSLAAPVEARYFRFTGLHAVEKMHVSAAEIGIIAAP